MSTEANGLSELRALPSAISSIDEIEGVSYAGHKLSKIYNHLSFDETTFLIWNQRLPTANELKAFKEKKRQFASLSTEAFASLKSTELNLAFDDRLASFLIQLDYEVSKRSDVLGELDESLFYLAQIEAAVCELLNNSSELHVTYDPSAHILERLLGRSCQMTEQNLFDQIRNLYAEHEMNAATFACRVTASTGVKSSACLATAYLTLLGPLHGGAVKESADHYLFENQNNITEIIERKLSGKEKIMGFGHRVYMKNGDPRYPLMRNVLSQIADQKQDNSYLKTCDLLRNFVTQRIGIEPNLDLAGAACFLQLGFKRDHLVGLIAISRLVGWCAHIIEQRQQKKIIRPRANYTGS